MKRIAIVGTAALVMGLVAAPAFAYGPHDPNCVECHSIHEAKGKAILAVPPNTAQQNPATGSSASGDVALCLGCHNEDEGIMPIHLMSTHPVGMKPNKVKVPAELLKADGSLGCTSCHDPHPANPNYRYLQGTTAKASDVGRFCAMCHPVQADTGAFASAPAKP